MAHTLKQFLKWTVQVVLLIIVVKFFGLQSLAQYRDEKTVVISSEIDLGEIPAPSVTVCATNKNTQMGFKDDLLTTYDYPTSEIIGDLCEGLVANDIVDCIENNTFNLSTAVHRASKGFSKKIDLTGPKFWNPEFSYSSAGLCHQMNANISLGQSQATGVLWIELNSTFRHTAFIHDPKFYFFSSNPQLPFNSMLIGATQIHSFRLVQHKKQNLASKPCQPDPQYSFTACVKNSFSKEVGCRLHWDRWSDPTLPVCHQLQQYRYAKT